MAQIGNLVARLSDRIAEASQNNRRNPQNPELPQLSKRPHISSFPPVKSWCRDDWRFTSGTLGAQTVSVQLKAELAHNPTNSWPVRTEGACGVPPSQRLPETTGPTLQSSKTSGGLTESWDDPTTAKAPVSPTFHTNWRENTQFENVSSQKQALNWN